MTRMDRWEAVNRFAVTTLAACGAAVSVWVALFLAWRVVVNGLLTAAILTVFAAAFGWAVSGVSAPLPRTSWLAVALLPIFGYGVSSAIWLTTGWSQKALVFLVVAVSTSWLAHRGVESWQASRSPERSREDLKPHRG